MDLPVLSTEWLRKLDLSSLVLLHTVASVLERNSLLGCLEVLTLLREEKHLII